MIETYRANPSFGDIGEFCKELETATQNVSLLQSGMEVLGEELSGVTSLLDQRTSGLSGIATPDYSSAGDSVDSCVSLGYISDVASSTDSKESVREEEVSEDQSDEALQGYNTVDNEDELLQIYSSGSFCWMNSIDDCPSPPPPPPPPLPPHLQAAISLYPFEGDAACSIPMAEGEEFLVTDGDQDGWIRVRRMDGRFFPDQHLVEGFVPTAFLRFLA